MFLLHIFFLEEVLNIEIIIPVIVGIVAVILGFVGGMIYRKRISEATIGSAEEKAKALVNEAIKEGAAKKKEALLEAKEEIHKASESAEREIRDRRNEVQR